MVAHAGALHDHVHVVQVGKDRILQALTVVGADRFQNIRVLLNDRFFCLMMDGEQTCPAIMYILRTGMLQHELPVGQRIEDMDTLQKKILCPSILNLSTDNMREEIEKLDATDMDIYHVDIMDGTFVPNFGMSVRELEMIRRITDAGHHKLIDCHMMIMNPHRYIKRIAEAGADIIYIHPESELIPSATLELIQLEGKKTGLILNPCTSLETVKDMLPITDYVMIMAVNPGFAGREFMPYTRQKFIELDNYRKEKGLNYHLMLDGGATREVIADLYHNCNVEGFVLGKQELFFQQDDYATCIDRIRTF